MSPPLVPIRERRRSSTPPTLVHCPVDSFIARSSILHQLLLPQLTTAHQSTNCSQLCKLDDNNQAIIVAVDIQHKKISDQQTVQITSTLEVRNQIKRRHQSCQLSLSLSPTNRLPYHTLHNSHPRVSKKLRGSHTSQNVQNLHHTTSISNIF